MGGLWFYTIIKYVIAMAFITKAEANKILGGTLSGPAFSTKSDIVSSGLAEDTPLSKYHDKQFIEASDVVAKPKHGLVLDCPFTTNAVDNVTGTALTLVDNNSTYNISYSAANGAYFRSSMGLKATRDTFIFPDKEFTIAFKFYVMQKGSGHTIALFLGQRNNGRQISINTPEANQSNLIWKAYETPNAWYHYGAMSLNTWYRFLCCVKNTNGTLRARSWMNGTLLRDTTGTGFPTLDGTIVVGNDTNMRTEGITGYIKDLKVYDICLSDTELAKLK